MPSQSNRNVILAIAVLAAISLTYGIRNFHKAMPEIGIDFKVSRSEALQNARTYLESRHYDLNGYHEAISFVSSGGDKLYIEKELGVERLTSLSEDSISIWKWRARFFKPLQKLEYIAYIDPKGRIVGYQRKIDEAAPGLSLDTTAARILGEAFLSGPASVPLEKWDLIETNSTDRPNRRDYTFTYELRNFKVKEATYRLTVELQGAEVSQYYYRLREPEDWWRDWEKQRAQNDLFGNIANGLAMLTMIAAFFYFFRHVKKSAIPWKTALGLGILLAVTNFIMGLNSIPMNLAWFNTTETFGSFLVLQIVLSLMSGVFLGLNLMLLFGAGEFLYRMDYPNKLRIPAIFSRRGMKSKEFFEATIVGYLLCAFDIGFITFYYIFGSKFGFWSPADIKYDESVSTWLPWIYPLAISLYASLTEEFWFRLFGISLFKRLTKSTFLALLIPAMIWAFLHSNYPQEPGYARGIELTFVGLVAGVVMLRFGIWATLVYHYVYDAVLIGLFLFRSQNVYFWTSGLIVCGFALIPAAVAGIYWLKNRRFENVEDLLNGAQLDEKSPDQITAHVAPTEAIPIDKPYVPAILSLSPVSRKTALVVGILGLATLLLPSTRQFGDDFSFPIDREKAVSIAGQALNQQFGIDPSEFKVGVKSYNTENDAISSLSNDYNSSDNHISYLKAHVSLDSAEELLQAPNGAQHYKWRVNFKKPLDATEYNAWVPMNGADPAVFRIIADSLPGPDYSVDSARLIANSLFKTSVHDASKYHEISERSNKRPNRRDWYFTYESIDSVAGSAYLRQMVSLQSDYNRVGYKWIKIPEEWERLEDKKSTFSGVRQGLFILLLLALIIWLLIRIGKSAKSGDVDWKSARRAGYVLMTLVLLELLLALPNFWIDYDTAKPLFSYMSEFVVKIFSLGALVFGVGLTVVGLIEYLSRESISGQPPVISSPSRWLWGRDDSTALIGLTGFYIGMGALLTWVAGAFQFPTHSWNTRLPEVIGFYLPALAAVAKALTGSILSGCGIFIVLYFLNKNSRKNLHSVLYLLIAILLALLIKLNNIDNWTSGEITWLSAKVVLSVTAGYFALRSWATGRLHVILTAWLVTELFVEGAGLIGINDSPYQTQGWVLIAISTIIFFALILKGYRKENLGIAHEN